jgi:hypothetical protein
MPSPHKPLRIRLADNEIDTILTVAGDALARETLSCGQEDAGKLQEDLAAFESGMDKLRAMLANRRARRLGRAGTHC